MTVNVWINEFHYDNTGTDAGEFIEIAGVAGTELTGWTIVLYNGSNGASYSTLALSGTIPDQQNGFGTVSVAAPGLQNGSPDGFALVAPGDEVVQFLSYEGSFMAVGGPANGLTSTDIGVAQSGGEPAGASIALTGSGGAYADFAWAETDTGNAGAVNGGQSFAAAVTVPVINEFVFNHTSTDTREYVEVKGAANTDLSGYTLLVIEGDAPGQGTIDRVIAVGTTDAAGYWSSGFLSQDSLENGTQTLLLVQGFTGTAGTDLDTDNDGVLDATPWAALTDAVAVNDGSDAGDRTYAGAPVLAGGYDGTSFTPGGASRIPDGTDTDSISDWVRNDFDLAGIPGFAGTAVEGEALNTPGAANQAVEPPVGETVSIDDVSLAEGDAGTSILTFTVTRSGNAGAFTIDYATADGTATAGSDYAASSGTLVFAAGGALTETVSVTIDGDTTAEPSETFTIALSNLVASTGITTILDGSGLGTIVNDDVALTKIYAIQGAGHKSGFVGGGVGDFGNSGDTRVNVEGVVTAISANGFYIQDATGDGDIATSDGIFVFTNTSGANFTAGQALTVGTTVRILGARVDEFRPGSDLTITELSISSSITGSSILDLGGNTAIAPVVLGVDRLLPTGVIEDDNFASFDPTTDAIDFWESLEGMVVQVPNPVAISPTNEFRSRDPNDSANSAGNPSEEIWVTTGTNFDAASQTARGGLIIAPGDFNPERIQIDDIRNNDIDLPSVDVGATLSTVTGVVHYDFGNFEVLVSESPTVVTPSTLAREVTTIAANSRQVTIGDYNVENLDPVVEGTDPGVVAGNDLYTRRGNSDDDDFAARAQHIVDNMGAPTIVALQEIQDDDGATISGVLTSDLTLQTLIQAIIDAGGPTYSYAYIAPATSNENGGQPNANIRQAFLYQADQVTPTGLTLLADPNPGETDGKAGDDFADSRKPLVGTFEANGVSFTVINNHLNSKGGDGALFGDQQPPVLTSELERIEQAKIINDYVDGLLALDPDARVMVVGDLNDFGWSAPVQTLEGLPGEQVLFDLADELLPVNERYTYNFDGNTQSLDSQLASRSLLENAVVDYDIVHVNSEFADKASDHDPSVSLLDFSAYGEELAGTEDADGIAGLGGDDSIAGLGGADTLSGDAGNDTLLGGADEDSLAGGEGDDSLDGGTAGDAMAGGAGDDTYAVDSVLDGVTEAAGEGLDTVRAGISYTLGAEVENLVLTGSSGNTGTGNGLANALTGNTGANVLDGRAGADTMTGLTGNDTYLVDNAGDLVVEAAGGGTDLVITTVSLVLAAEVENMQLAGNVAINGGGNGLANRINGNDVRNQIDAAAGNDTVFAEAGRDVVRGGTGNDLIFGGDENDRLNGQAGNDTLSGDAGADIFSFQGLQFGQDVVSDFETGFDLIELRSTGFASAAQVLDFTVDTAAGARILVSPTATILLEGVLKADLATGDFLLA